MPPQVGMVTGTAVRTVAARAQDACKAYGAAAGLVVALDDVSMSS